MRRRMRVSKTPIPKLVDQRRAREAWAGRVAAQRSQRMSDARMMANTIRRVDASSGTIVLSAIYLAPSCENRAGEVAIPRSVCAAYRAIVFSARMHEGLR